MDFDAIESGRERIARGLPEIVDDGGDFAGLQRPRGLVGRDLSVRRHGLQLA
jgi:hypothetical protein